MSVSDICVLTACDRNGDMTSRQAAACVKVGECIVQDWLIYVDFASRSASICLQV